MHHRLNYARTHKFKNRSLRRRHVIVKVSFFVPVFLYLPFMESAIAVNIFFIIKHIGTRPRRGFEMKLVLKRAPTLKTYNRLISLMEIGHPFHISILVLGVPSFNVYPPFTKYWRMLTFN